MKWGNIKQGRKVMRQQKYEATMKWGNIKRGRKVIWGNKNMGQQ